MEVSGISESTDMTAIRKQMMERVFKKMDSDGNGTISKDELQKATDERKAATGKNAPTNLPSVDDLFKSADVNGDGGISQDELLAQMSMMGPPPGKNDGTQGAQGDGPSGGAPAAGACGGSPPAGASDKTQSSASSSKLSIDPADANVDGRVSAAERRAHDYKQLIATLVGALKDTNSATGGSTSKAESPDSVSVVV